MRTKSSSFVLVLTLVLGFLLPTPLSQADGVTIDKTFVVVDSSNNPVPVAGATVRVYWFNPAAFTEEYRSAITDSTGTAIISGLPKNGAGGNFEYVVVPPVSDLVNAASEFLLTPDSAGGTVSVTLNKADFFVNVLKKDSQGNWVSAENAYVNFPPLNSNGGNAAFTRVVRSGIIGLHLDSSIPTGSYSIAVGEFESQASKNAFTTRYGISLTKNPNSSFTVTARSDAPNIFSPNLQAREDIAGGAVLELKLLEGNVGGVLYQYSANPATKNPVVVTAATPTLIYLRSNTPSLENAKAVRPSAYPMNQFNAADGAWHARLSTFPETDSFVSSGFVSISGSHIYPTFPLRLYKNSSGFSLTENDLAGKTTDVDIRLPNPSSINFKMRYGSPNGLPFSWTLMNKSDNSVFARGFSPNGLLSAVIPASSMLGLDIFPFGGSSQLRYEISVPADPSNLAVTSFAGVAISPSDGVYDFSENFNFRAVTKSNSNVPIPDEALAYLRVCAASASFVQNEDRCIYPGVSSGGLGALSLTQGNYVLTLYPRTQADGPARFHVSVATNGTIVVNKITPTSPSQNSTEELVATNGIFMLSGESNNVLGTVSAQNTPVEKVRVECRLWNASENRWDGCKDSADQWIDPVETDEQGKFGFRVPNGKYRFIYIPTTGTLGSALSDEVTVANLTAAPVTQSLTSANLQVSAQTNPVVNFTSAELHFQIELKLGSGDQNFINWGGPLRSDYAQYFTLPTTLGTPPQAVSARVKIEKASWSQNPNLNGFAPKSTSWMPITNQSTIQQITLSRGNLRGTVLRLNGQQQVAVTQSNTSWLDINLQPIRKNEGVINSDYSSTWIRPNANTGEFSLQIENAGAYRLLANVNGYSDITSTFSSCIFAFGTPLLLKTGPCSLTPDNLDQSSFAAISGQGVSEASADITSFAFLLSAPNIQGTIKNSAGSAIGSTSSGWIDLVLQSKRNPDNAQDLGWDWIRGGISVSNQGVFSLNISSPGLYRLQARPNRIAGVASGYSDCIWVNSELKFVVRNCSDATTVNYSSASSSINNLIVTLPTPVIQGVVQHKSNAVPFTNVELFKSRGEGRGEDWVDSTNTDGNGLFSLSVDAPGDYLVKVNPPWNGSLSDASSKTYPITVALNNGVLACLADACGVQKTFALGVPNVTGTVTTATGQAIVPSNGVSVWITPKKYTEGQGFQWTQNGTSLGLNGKYQLGLGEGLYKLGLQPTGVAGATTTESQCFKVNASLKVSNTFSCDGKEPNSFKDSLVLDVALSSPNLLGTLKSGSQAAPFAWIEIRQALSDGGYSFEIPGASTDVNGNFAIAVTKTGDFELIAHPGGSSNSNATKKLYTLKAVSSSPSGPITVELRDPANSNQVVPLTNSRYQISLGQPNLVGSVQTLLDPDGVGPNPASWTNFSIGSGQGICIWAEKQISPNNWQYANADGCARSNGGFSMSLPSTGTYRLKANLWGISEYSFDATEPFTVTDLSVPLTQNIQLQVPNLLLKVMTLPPTSSADQGSAIANSWIELRKNNGTFFEWAGGSNTDFQGQTSIRAANGDYQLFVNAPWNNPSLGAQNSYYIRVDGATITFMNSSFTAPDVSETRFDSTSNRFTVGLALSNFTGLISDITGQVWMEVLDQDYQWQKGTSVNSNNRRFALDLANTGPNQHWIVRLNPSERDLAIGLGARSYKVTVAGGQPSVKLLRNDGSEGQAVNDSQGDFTLSLATASVRGRVVNGTAGVADSWVVPANTQTGEELWRLGSGSRTGGNFALALDAGTYRLSARAPWNTPGLAGSETCVVEVNQQAQIVANGTTCDRDENGLVTLGLRQPNLTVTIQSPNGTVQPNSWVWIQVGSWGAGSNSDATGKATFVINPSEIRGANSGFQASDQLQMRIQVNSPWGSSLSGTYKLSQGKDDSTPQKDIPFVTGNSFASTDLVIKLRESNTTVTIKRGETFAPNAWVEIFKVLSGGGLEWIQGSSTNSQGQARFDLSDDQTARYKVRVWPSQSDRVTYSDTWFGGATGVAQATVNSAQISLATANVSGRVLISNGVGSNSFGWIGIEDCGSDSSYTQCNFLSGIGLDAEGRYNTYLPEGNYYRITAHPGANQAGASKTVNRQVSGGSNTVNITLSAGNVTGRVTKSANTGVAGAFVTATLMGTNTKLTTTTQDDGSYGFDLDFSGGKVWSIQASPPKADKNLSANTLTVSSATTNANIALS